MAEIITAGNRKITGFAKPRQHRSTTVDLTPMVDLGFLLITFFVFTTTMSQPMAMNFIQPDQGDITKIKASGAMTILLSADHRVAYYFGILNSPALPGQLQLSNFKEIRSVMLAKKNTTTIEHLMYVIKCDSTASFGSNIDLLDELAICNVPAGHYCESEIDAGESSVFSRLF